MPQDAKIFRLLIFQNLPVTLLAQVKSLATGKFLVAADIDTMTFNILDLASATPDTPVNSGSVTVATALHTPKLDDRWVEDREGFNFDHTLPAGIFPISGRTYALQYLFTGVGDDDPSGMLLYHIQVLNARGQ
jgi:hypothetical protein